MQPLPELPPMKPMPASAPDSSSPSTSGAAAPMKSAPVGSKRLRQMISMITGAGLTLVLVIIFFELVARPGVRPSDLAAAIEGRIELGIMNIKLGHAPGELVLTEAQYQSALAEAQRQGQAKAELDYQTKLAIVQADKEMVVGAYQSLYQRANVIAQAALQLETVAQQFRQQLLTMSNGGRSAVIMFKDIFCGIGSPEACASARADRETMIGEADELSRGDIGGRVRELMAGVDDPATLIARMDGKRKGTPHLRH